MAKMRAGYRSVRCGLETTEDGLAVLEFWRADGKIVVVTMTAENVLALSESMLALLETPTEEVTLTPSTPIEETDNVTADA